MKISRHHLRLLLFYPLLNRELTDTKQSISPQGGLPQDTRQSLEQRADAGDAQAQYDLALAYLTGGRPETPAMAAEPVASSCDTGFA